MVRKVILREAELLLLPRKKHAFTDPPNEHSQTASSVAPLSPTYSRSVGENPSSSTTTNSAEKAGQDEAFIKPLFGLKPGSFGIFI